MIKLNFSCKNCKTKGELGDKEFIIYTKSDHQIEGERLYLRCDICGTEISLLGGEVNE